jgi:hypothetical protein
MHYMHKAGGWQPKAISGWFALLILLYKPNSIVIIYIKYKLISTTFNKPHKNPIGKDYKRIVSDKINKKYSRVAKG